MIPVGKTQQLAGQSKDKVAVNSIIAKTLQKKVQCGKVILLLLISQSIFIVDECWLFG